METGITLLCGTHIPSEWIFKPITQMAAHGRTILVVDGENSFRSYWIARYAREMGLNPQRALESVRISRAFTCFQLAELITQKLGPLAEAGCAGIVCLGLLETLNDEDVPPAEAARLLRSIGAALKTLATSCPILITMKPPSPRVSPRLGLVHSLMQLADKVYVAEAGADERMKDEGGRLKAGANEPMEQLPIVLMLNDKSATDDE